MSAANVFIRRIREIRLQRDDLSDSSECCECRRPDRLQIGRGYAGADRLRTSPWPLRMYRMLAEANGRVRLRKSSPAASARSTKARRLQEELVHPPGRAACACSGRTALACTRRAAVSPSSRILRKKSAHVGIMSQSGGLGTDIVRRGSVAGLALFSAAVTVGNCADVGAERSARILPCRPADQGDRDLPRSGAKDGRRLFDILRKAHRAKKPVVILKGGRTQQGLPAAASHTGSLAGDDRVWVALARQTGCMLVDTLDHFIDTLLIFQTLTPRPQRPDAQGRDVRQRRRHQRARHRSFRPLGLDVTPFGNRNARRAGRR
jgi:hypothetical protein